MTKRPEQERGGATFEGMVGRLYQLWRDISTLSPDKKNEAAFHQKVREIQSIYLSILLSEIDKSLEEGLSLNEALQFAGEAGAVSAVSHKDVLQALMKKLIKQSKKDGVQILGGHAVRFELHALYSAALDGTFRHLTQTPPIDLRDENQVASMLVACHALMMADAQSRVMNKSATLKNDKLSAWIQGRIRGEINGSPAIQIVNQAVDVIPGASNDGIGYLVAALRSLMNDSGVTISDKSSLLMLVDRAYLLVQPYMRWQSWQIQILDAMIFVGKNPFEYIQGSVERAEGLVLSEQAKTFYKFFETASLNPLNFQSYLEFMMNSSRILNFSPTVSASLKWVLDIIIKKFPTEMEKVWFFMHDIQFLQPTEFLALITSTSTLERSQLSSLKRDFAQIWPLLQLPSKLLSVQSARSAEGSRRQGRCMLLGDPQGEAWLERLKQYLNQLDIPELSAE